MKSAKGRVIIEPVSGFRNLCGLQKSNLIIVVQRAHTDTGEVAYLFYGSHFHHLVITV